MTLRKHRTTDKEAVDVHTVTKIGRTQSLTPEGFLFCEDVPIKRVGEMYYGPGETPIKVGSDGIARVTRDAQALFEDTAIASYSGKPVVNDHPDTDVTPANWKKLAVGTVLNPRQGVGDAHDVMVADLLITDKDAIRDVLDGKREVSAGYEADYEQTGEGTGRQTHIIGNHVALVKKGRCGPRCSIGDHSTTTLKGNHMGTQTKPRRKISDSVAAIVRKTFRDAEEAALAQLGNSGMPEGTEEEPDGDEGADEGASHTHIHIHNDAGQAHAGAEGEAPPNVEAPPQDPIEARLAALEDAIGQIMQMLQGGGEEAPPEEAPAEGGPPEEGGEMEAAGPAPEAEGGEQPPQAQPEPKKTTDSAALATSYQQLMSDAEILVPGFRFPTFDAALPRKLTIDSMCGLRRQVLGTVYNTTDGKNLIDGVAMPGFSHTTSDCATVAAAFRAAAGAKRLSNNRSMVGDASRIPDTASAGGKVTSLAALNASYASFWASKAKK